MKRPPCMVPSVPCVGDFGMGSGSHRGQWAKCPANTRTKDPTHFLPPPPPQVQPRLRHPRPLDSHPTSEGTIRLHLAPALWCKALRAGAGRGVGPAGQGLGPSPRPPRPLGTKSKGSTCLWGRGRQARTQGGDGGGLCPLGRCQGGECVQGTP